MHSEESQLDRRIRRAAIRHVLTLRDTYGAIAARHVERGFEFAGQRIHLASRAEGIFKPRTMETLLSLKTVFPRKGRTHWYDDQQLTAGALLGETEFFRYDLAASPRKASRNDLIAQAAELQFPIIYFLGLAPGLYEAVAPAFVSGVDRSKGTCRVMPGAPIPSRSVSVVRQAMPETSEARQYYMRQTRQRAHQGQFRAAVLAAYKGRCAVTGLPVEHLIDAAHIMPDTDAEWGQPVVPNGLPLSKIHHSAFDAGLIGIDPDYRIHVAARLQDESDGPMLELLKESHGRSIHLPPRRRDRPDRERLAKRFQRFKPRS